MKQEEEVDYGGPPKEGATNQLYGAGIDVRELPARDWEALLEFARHRFVRLELSHGRGGILVRRRRRRRVEQWRRRVDRPE